MGGGELCLALLPQHLRLFVVVFLLHHHPQFETCDLVFRGPLLPHTFDVYLFLPFLEIPLPCYSLFIPFPGSL